jgi:hypothetical protein
MPKRVQTAAFYSELVEYWPQTTLDNFRRVVRPSPAIHEKQIRRVRPPGDEKLLKQQEEWIGDRQWSPTRSRLHGLQSAAIGAPLNVDQLPLEIEILYCQ